MIRLHALTDLAVVPGPVQLAIGFFDGVHLGHQEVIRAATAAAQEQGGSAVVMTFDPHPARVLRPESAPRLLTSTAHKAMILSHLGVERLLILPFDAELASLAPAEFVHRLVAAAKPLAGITVGEAWAFGCNRSGNIGTLRDLARECGFTVRGIPPVIVGGEPVSSTRVRLAVERGDFAAAERLLGRRYSVFGTVVHGRQLGRTLGFPTANLALEAEQLPPIGVYAVRVDTGTQLLEGVANLGWRPTVEEGASVRQLEVHLFDFDGDLYGRTLDVRFEERLRDERKMESLDALKAQIARDIEQARRLFDGHLAACG